MVRADAYSGEGSHTISGVDDWRWRPTVRIEATPHVAGVRLFDRGESGAASLELMPERGALRVSRANGMAAAVTSTDHGSELPVQAPRGPSGRTLASLSARDRFVDLALQSSGSSVSAVAAEARSPSSQLRAPGGQYWATPSLAVPERR